MNITLSRLSVLLGLLGLVAAFGFMAQTKAGDTKTSGDTKHTYSGEITGVVCSSCKETVQTSLMKNLAGVFSVNVELADKPDTQKITIVSSSDKVTADAANKALGEYAKEYKVVKLNPEK